MGANAQTSVPVFTSGQVLTAQQQTEINTGIPVFATTTTRDAAFGGTGEKTLAEGQFAYIEATNTTQYYDGAAWQTLGGGLTFIKSQTIGSAVSSVTVTDAFSATYDNYRIIVTGGVGSVAEDVLNMTLGSTATGYYWSRNGRTWANADAATASANTTSWRAGGSSTQSIFMIADVTGPYLAEETAFTSTYLFTSTGAAGGGTITWGFLNNTTSYTAFTLTSNSGTLTGGTIRVYGYQNS